MESKPQEEYSEAAPKISSPSGGITLLALPATVRSISQHHGSIAEYEKITPTQAEVLRMRGKSEFATEGDLVTFLTNANTEPAGSS